MLIILYAFITAPPERFDHNMNSNEFFLFLNANGLSHKVCQKLEGENILIVKGVKIGDRYIISQFPC